jgi:hypothetical protein
MKKAMWSQEQLAEISAIQETRNLTRKSAVQFYTRQQKSAKPEPVAAHPLEVAAVKQAVKTAAKVNAKKSGTPGKSSKGTWADQNTEKAVRLFKAGKTISEIAESFGDKTKQNRVRGALAMAGVYEFKSVTAKRFVAKRIKALAAKA